MISFSLEFPLFYMKHLNYILFWLLFAVFGGFFENCRQIRCIAYFTPHLTTKRTNDAKLRTLHKFLKFVVKFSALRTWHRTWRQIALIFGNQFILENKCRKIWCITYFCTNSRNLSSNTAYLVHCTLNTKLDDKLN